MCLDTVDVNDKALMTGMRHVRGLYLTGPLSEDRAVDRFSYIVIKLAACV